jgi:hypothetical protein
MADSRKKAGPAKGSVVETRNVTYLAAGVGVDPYEGNTPTLDPELEKLRDAEAAKASDVPSSAPLGEPTIDPELVKIRAAEIKRDAERAKASQPAPVKATASAPAKKAAPQKSSN